MEQQIDPSPWQPLSLLREQFHLNLASLRKREARVCDRLEQVAPTEDYFVAPAEDRIQLGRMKGLHIEPLPSCLPPRAARAVAAKLFPTGYCTEPVLVAGLDQGWLWNVLYHMEVSTPRTPGHRPPLYFLAGEVERLWVVLHMHDWTKLLSDRRVRLFVGDDCIRQAQQSMIEDAMVPWPKLSVTVDPSIWPPGMSLDSILATAHRSANERLNHLLRELKALDASADPRSLARRLTGGKLRVLGITSLFTTFLQYSMRDWLAAFAELGHETRMLIEREAHEVANPPGFASICAEFQPDLILLIDHYRAAFSGLPQNVPCVMWVQDRLPNIFRAAAGAAQGPMDFVLGYGRQECVLSHGYPRDRFMPAMVGFNERRFAAREISADESRRHSCDVSFVSHASIPAEILVQREIDKAALPEARRFLADAFERLRASYDEGSFVTEAGHIRRIVYDAMRACGVESSDSGAVVDFFTQRVNNALFRQQAISWLAEMDVNLHLYGRGWEDHPRFGRHARGVADNEQELSAIYQSSAINLQVTPFGAVHQRLFDGLSAGGFFLLRHCTGDTCDLIYRQMWEWCRQPGVCTGEEFFHHAPQHVREMIDRIIELTGEDPAKCPDGFFLGLEEAATAGFKRSPATLWPEYDRVTFSTREELQNLVRHFLRSPDERRAIARSMRNRVVDSMSYKGITRRLLSFLAEDISRRFPPVAIAA